jgi:hypothetical protein
MKVVKRIVLTALYLTPKYDHTSSNLTLIYGGVVTTLGCNIKYLMSIRLLDGSHLLRPVSSNTALLVLPAG